MAIIGPHSEALVFRLRAVREGHQLVISWSISSISSESRQRGQFVGHQLVKPAPHGPAPHSLAWQSRIIKGNQARSHLRRMDRSRTLSRHRRGPRFRLRLRLHYTKGRALMRGAIIGHQSSSGLHYTKGRALKTPSETLGGSSQALKTPLYEGPRPQSPPPPPPPPAPSLHPTHQDNAFAPPRLSRIHSEARRPCLMREVIRGNQWHSGRSTFKLIGSSRRWLTCCLLLCGG